MLDDPIDGDWIDYDVANWALFALQTKAFDSQDGTHCFSGITFSYLADTLLHMSSLSSIFFSYSPVFIVIPITQYKNWNSIPHIAALGCHPKKFVNPLSWLEAETRKHTFTIVLLAGSIHSTWTQVPLTDFG